MDYAIIKVGNKQHRVHDGETLVVERVPTEEGKTFEPVVLLGDEKVTATVLAHERGPKIIVGKYKRRTGYKRHNGFRAAISRLEITIGAGTKRAPAKKQRARKEEPVEAVETPDAVAAPEVVEAAPAEAVETPTAETADGAPSGYESMTVAQIHTAAKDWHAEELEAALEYERSHGARKGAISALESALKKDEAAADEAPASEEEG
jgi:large subunit ribosomal protein L21